MVFVNRCVHCKNMKSVGEYTSLLSNEKNKDSESSDDDDDDGGGGGSGGESKFLFTTASMPQLFSCMRQINKNMTASFHQFLRNYDLVN